MLTSRLRVMTRELIEYTIVVALGLLLLFALTGCMVQPTDAATGKTFGDPISTLDKAPTTSPAGNPVVLHRTDKVDVDRVVEEGGAGLQNVLVEFGPWGVIAAGAVGIAIQTYRSHRRNKKAAK